MLSVLLAIDDAQRLSEILEALVPAAVDGLVRQVVISVGADPVLSLLAEDAGAEIVEGRGVLGKRLAAAAAAARQPWLFIPTVDLPADWRPRVEAQFGRGGAGRFAGGLLDGVFGKPRGLLTPRTAYEQAGGFHDVEPAEADLVKRLGRVAKL